MSIQHCLQVAEIKITKVVVLEFHANMVLFSKHRV